MRWDIAATRHHSLLSIPKRPEMKRLYDALLNLPVLVAVLWHGLGLVALLFYVEWVIARGLQPIQLLQALIGLVLIIVFFLLVHAAFRTRVVNAWSQTVTSESARPKEIDDKTHVTYVVDRDLIRFAKFSGAILTVFLVVGVSFYGFDVKQTAKEIADTKRETRDLLEEITRIEQETKRLSDEAGVHSESVENIKKEMTALLSDSKDLLSEHMMASRALVKTLLRGIESEAADPPQTSIDREPPSDRRASQNARWLIYDLENKTSQPGTLARAEGDPDVDDAEVNQAYTNVEHVHRFLADVLHRDSLDDKGIPIIVAVHYGLNFANAWWNGERLILGEGDGKFFKTFNTLDVVAKELGRAHVHFTAELRYHGQSGALTEHFSDVFAVLVEQWVHKKDASQADWLLGEGSIGPEMNGVAFRSMKEPGAAFEGDPQPSHMDDYKASSGGDDQFNQINSGIPNHAFYLAATKIGGNAWEQAGRIWYEALLASDQSSQFSDFAKNTLDAANRLYGPESKQSKSVKDAWNEVGVSVSLD
jgi:Zn-dependent metalloprotease